MTPNPIDIILWPDYFCYRYGLEEYSWKSDDYEVFYFGTPEYDNFTYHNFTNEIC